MIPKRKQSDFPMVFPEEFHKKSDIFDWSVSGI